MTNRVVSFAPQANAITRPLFSDRQADLKKMLKLAADQGELIYDRLKALDGAARRFQADPGLADADFARDVARLAVADPDIGIRLGATHIVGEMVEVLQGVVIGPQRSDHMLVRHGAMHMLGVLAENSPENAERIRGIAVEVAARDERVSLVRREANRILGISDRPPLRRSRNAILPRPHAV
ncbi:MAG: hypothetical protein WDO70_03880 [Alphaproteobacteria bacterium]